LLLSKSTRPMSYNLVGVSRSSDRNRWVEWAMATA
jgi:hypothetical protein